MKFLFFSIIIFISIWINTSSANTYIQTNIDNHLFRVVWYPIWSQLYNIKIARSEEAISMNDLLNRNNAITWINWVFFCPSDYTSCNWKTYTHNEVYVEWEKFWWVFWTWDRVVFWWDELENPFLYQTDKINKDRESEIYYWFWNFPLLVKEWKITTLEYWDKWLIDTKMMVKWTRNFVCSDKDNKNIYFWLVSNADIDDLAVALVKFWCYNAINLDAWFSTAFSYNWRFISGPGRDILDWIVIESNFIKIDNLDNLSKKIAKKLISNIPKNNLDNQLKYIDKIIEKLWIYRNNFYKNFSTDLYDDNWLKNWYKIDVNSKSALKTIYTINKTSEYLRETKNVLKQFYNLSTSNPLGLNIKVELEF